MTRFNALSRVLLCFTLLTRAAAAPTVADDTLTPYDVARLRTADSPKMSPDGRLVAHVVRVPRQPWADAKRDEKKEKDGQSWGELHVVDLEGVSRPFVAGRVSVGNVEWTPDGDGISFTAKRGEDKNTCLYVIPIDGGEARRVVSHQTDVGAYSWSPNGMHVAFLATRKKTKKIRDREEIGLNQEIIEEDWQSTRVWIATIDSAKRAKALDLPGSASAVHWSPDGSRLCVVLAPTPSVDDGYMRKKIHVVDVESGKVTATVDNPGKLEDVSWSTDGRNLAFIGAADLNDPQAGRLTVAALEGGAARDVLPDLKVHVTAIAWQDAETIMYLADEGVQTRFGKVKLDGTEGKVILPAEKFTLGGLSLSKDGRCAAFVGDAPTHHSEIFYMKHGNAEPRRLTDVNPWLKDKRFAKQEVVTYKARDGLELQGILIHPLDEKPGTRYPLILSVHGGPEAHEHNGWLTGYSRPGQVAAARGFAVFQPNYRGSTGRGVAFSKMGQGDCGGKEFDDLVDAVDYFIASGLADKEKVGVTGGSYGGYASAWCATRFSDRFAASVMFVGISDQISKAGTTDIPNEMYLVHERAWPWEKWDEFREASPLFHAQKCKTPILIMGGKDDPRVHPSQSMELFRYLKVLGKAPVRLVQYPGEGHGNRKASARLDYHLRMMQWFDHYLKGPGGKPPKYAIDYEWEKKADVSDGAKPGNDSMP